MNRFDVIGMYYTSSLDRMTTDGCGGRAVVPKYINSQYEDGVGDRRLGITTVSHGGCGVVATNNALMTLCAGKPFGEVLDYFNESPNRTVAGGLLGILPYQIKEYFVNEGYRVIVANGRDAIDIHSQTADACILLYAFPVSYLGVDLFGAHFVHYRKTGKEYIVYNDGYRTGRITDPYEYGTSNGNYCPIGIFIYK